MSHVPTYSEPPILLRARWRMHSAAGTWAFPDDWFCPAVDALLEAMSDGRAIELAAEQLGRQRAAASVALPESFDDLAALAAVVGADRVDAAVYRAFATGWADVTASAQVSVECIDPITGLSTAAYLRTRLGEIYRGAQRDGVDPGDRYALVVAAYAPDAVVAPRRFVFGAATQLISLHRMMSAVFPDDETLSATGPRIAVALVRRDETLGRRHAALRAMLATDTRPTRTWIERLPRSLASARELIGDLSR